MSSFSEDINSNSSQIINPFICSTDDFVVERNHLSSHVFPILQAHCRGQLASFLPFEWDHSIDEDRLERGHALRLALQCIEFADPFCIVLLGDNYGSHRPKDSGALSADTHWIDKNIIVAAQAGYKWLLDESYINTSLLELKIIQAAFLGENTKFCRFYIRERQSANTGQYSTEAERFSHFKLQQLKANIAKRGLYVSYYKDVEELGELVLYDWKSIVNQLYPPLKTNTIGKLEIADRIKHQRFGSRTCHRLVKHSGVTNCYKQLHAFICHINGYSYDPFVRAKHFEKSTGIRLLRKGRSQYPIATPSNQRKSICVVTGPRGSGKSVIVSSWLRSEVQEVVPPDTVIICHYAACDRMARNIAVFMKRCISRLRQAFTTKYDEEISMESEFSEFTQIKETFLAALALGPCLIVFDGLDEIAATMGQSMIEMKSMEWLADPLPPTCKIIFTVTDSDLCVKALRKRVDTVFCACGEVTDTQSKEEILHSYLSQNGDQPHPVIQHSHVSQITQYKLSSSPLYLSIIANELNDMHVHSDIEAHLHVYANLDSISTSTRDMWTSLIKRWVRDYSWRKYADNSTNTLKSSRLQDTIICGWVPDCLRLLTCSKDGLSVNEILSTLFYGLGYMGPHTVTHYDWYLFYNAARGVFYEKPDGLITINHEHLMEVVDFLLLGNISPPSLHETSSDSNSMQRLGGMARRQYHLSLASQLLSLPAEEQLSRMEEILWQLEIAADYEKLCDMIFTPKVMEKLYGRLYCTYTPLRIELIRFYKLLKDKNIDILTRIMDQLDKLQVTTSGHQNDERTTNGQQVLHTGQEAESVDNTKAPMSRLLVESESAFRRVIAEDSVEYVRSESSDTSKGIATDSMLSSVASGKGTLSQSQSAPDQHPVSEGARNNNNVNGRSQEMRGEGYFDDDQHESNLLPSAPVSRAKMASLALTCAKLLLILDDGREGEKVLTSLVQHITQEYPLNYEELYVMCHVYQELSHLNISKQEYYIALEQLHKSHECLLDISCDQEGLDVVSDKLRTYIKGCLQIEMSGVCLMAGDLHMAQSYLNEANVGMEEIHCTPGTKYILYNHALQKAGHQNYQTATNYLLQCLNYFELSFGTMHPIVAEISHSLGTLLSDIDNQVTSNDAAAKEYLWKALNIRRERDDESLATAESLFQLAFLVQREGSKTRKKEAMELLQSCLDIRSSKLGNEHESTKTVVYLLNDLEISLQLGQFEFGEARPIDNRSPQFPFSELSMHEKALLDYNQPKGNRQRPLSSNQRPHTAFSIEKPRGESRLHQALVRRPKTAPTALVRPSSSSKRNENRALTPDIPKIDLNRVNNPYVPEIEPSSIESTPRTYRSYSREVGDSRMSTRSYKSNVLERYSIINRNDEQHKERGNRPSTPKTNHPTSANVKKHKCHEIGTHTIHKNLHSTTLGPNSTVTSVAGYIRPLRKTEPVHQSAWYHFPNHYSTTQKPHINPKVYVQRRKRLMQQRSQSAPVRSRYLNDHSNAIRLIAQHESSLDYYC